MSVIIILIGCSVSLAILFLILFIRATRRGQYDDAYTPGIRMLFDDTKPVRTSKPKHPKT